jgi:opacity protein-like surface antigen
MVNEMNRLCALAGLPLVILGLAAQADTIGTNRIGVNGSYSTGGEVQNPQGGFGAQGEFAINRNFGIELAVDQFSDDSTQDGIEITQDLTTIGLAMVFRGQFNQRFGGYGLIGLDYNMPNTHVTLDPGYYGPGWHASANLDDAFGGHFGGGLNLRLADHVELFLEYRYTALELKGDLTVTNGNYSYTDRVTGNNDFGLFKLGINVVF